MLYIHKTTNITFEIQSSTSTKVKLVAVDCGTSSLFKVGDEYVCSLKELKRSFKQKS